MRLLLSPLSATLGVVTCVWSLTAPHSVFGAVSRDEKPHVSFHGKLELEFGDIQNGPAIEDRTPHFHLGKFRLEPEIGITQTIRLEADLDFEEGGAKVDEVYILFKTIDKSHQVIIGKDDNVFAMKRVTNRYPLIATAAWRDEELGIRWIADWGLFNSALSWTNGYAIGDKSPGNIDSYDFLRDENRDGDHSVFREWSAKLGFPVMKEKETKLSIHALIAIGILSDSDIDTLQDKLGGYTSNSTIKNRFGGGAEFKFLGFHSIGQALWMNDGDLNRKGWFAQIGHPIPLIPSGLGVEKHTFWFRVGQLQVDWPADPTDSHSWDRSEVTLAIHSEMNDWMTLKTEYTLDGETTGSTGLDNNELILQLQARF